MTLSRHPTPNEVLELAIDLVQGKADEWRGITIEQREQSARVLQRMLLLEPKPVYAHPARDTADGIAYTLDAEPKPQAEYQTLYRNPIAQLTSDVLTAWSSAEISEGQACHLLDVDRVTLRTMRMDAIGRVTGPIDDEQMVERRRAAQKRLDDFVANFVENDGGLELSDDEAATVVQAWGKLVGSYEFVALFEEWRYLCPPATSVSGTEEGA